MITSKEITTFLEQYVTTKNIASNDVVIYVNPTYSDYAELYKTGPDVRFIVDNKNKKLYAWNGYLAAHSSILTSGSLPVNLSCVWAQGKMLSRNSLPILTEFRPKKNDTNNYSWLSSYIKLPNQSLNNYYMR